MTNELATLAWQRTATLHTTARGLARVQVPVTQTALNTSGYTLPGDLGAARYCRVAAQPAHAGKLQTADGAWWELAEWSVAPQMFGATTTADATAAIQATFDFCYNGGTTRAQVHLPANCTFTVSDPNGDGYCLLLYDGVTVTGSSVVSSILTTTTANVVILRRIRSGIPTHAGYLRDFCIDGQNVAKGCLELFGSAYDAQGGVLLCRNARRPVVYDAVQNYTSSGITVSNAGEWSYSILNGAGSVTLDKCFARYARYGHILVDNDPTYPGYALGPAPGVTGQLAYATPNNCTIVGGVYESNSPANPGDFKTVLRINCGSRITVTGNPVFATVANVAESAIDDGRYSLSAANVLVGAVPATNAFRIPSVDVRAAFPAGTRVLCIGANAATYGPLYPGTAYVLDADQHLMADRFMVALDRTAVFTAGTIVRIINKDGTTALTTVQSSAASTSAGKTTTTVIINQALVTRAIVSVTVGYAWGTVASTAYATDTTITLTMDTTGSVTDAIAPNLTTVEIGRGDDAATAVWSPGVYGSKMTDVQIATAGSVDGTSGTFNNPAIRSGAFQSIYTNFTFAGVNGDWFVLSQQGAVIRPGGSLGASALRCRHVKGVYSGGASISYTPLNLVNAGVFEVPGHAFSMMWSSSGGAMRWYNVNDQQWHFIPIMSYGAGAPTFNATHVGQQWIDTTSNKIYVATRTGTGASDWQLLN